jgi:hypothetical protein
MAKYYIRLSDNGADIARTFTLTEALYVAQSESSKDGGLFSGKILSITHNRKVVAYVQDYCIVREINDDKYFITPERFVEALSEASNPKVIDEFWGSSFAENGIYLND